MSDPIKIENGFTDEQVLFLSDIFPTGLHGGGELRYPAGRHDRRLGLRPVGQFAIQSAFLLGAERVIAIDRFPERLRMAREKAAPRPQLRGGGRVSTALKEMTGGRGPDACIDAVGMEAHGHGPAYAYDRAKQAMMLETRPADRLARGNHGLPQRRHRIRSPASMAASSTRFPWARS